MPPSGRAGHNRGRAGHSDPSGVVSTGFSAWCRPGVASRQRPAAALAWARAMKTIGYLGQLDRLLGTPVTTRSWNTITAVMGILKRQAKNLR